MKEEFDVLIASYDRALVLRKCLESVRDIMPESLKNIIVLTQREDVETIELLDSLSKELPLIKIVVDNKISPGASRNKLINNSSAEFLQFLDDDAFLPKDYYKRINKLFCNESFDVLGGPDQSPNDGRLNQIILGKVLESSFVMGPTFARHSTKSYFNKDADEVILTLCNLWVKRSLFTDDEHYFDEEILRCEENLFLERLNDYIKIYDPELFVFHKRRDSLSELAKIQFKSGYYRGVTFSIDAKTYKPFFLIPIITGVLLVIFPYIPSFLQSILIVFHLVLTSIVSLNIMVETKQVESFFISWFMITIIHFFFSLGILFGSIKGRFKNG